MKKGTTAKIIALEKAGRFDEAGALYVANTTPEERDCLDAAMKKFAETIANIPPEAWAEGEELMKRFRVLEELPEDDYKRIIWERFWGDTPASMSRFDWRKRLPDPLAKKGRPRGSGKISDDVLLELDRRILELGEVPTPAAKRIVGDVAGAKNRADYLVKKHRERGKKST